jgi:hypothetical protein
MLKFVKSIKNKNLNKLCIVNSTSKSELKNKYTFNAFSRLNEQIKKKSFLTKCILICYLDVIL